MPASQHQSPKSDIEIAQAAKKRPIMDIAREKLGIGLEVFGTDAELLARDVHDQAFLGGLRDIDVGLGILVLRGGHVK